MTHGPPAAGKRHWARVLVLLLVKQGLPGYAGLQIVRLLHSPGLFPGWKGCRPQKCAVPVSKPGVALRAK